jgi:hypothetical protein
MRFSSAVAAAKSSRFPSLITRPSIDRLAR